MSLNYRIVRSGDGWQVRAIDTHYDDRCWWFRLRVDAVDHIAYLQRWPLTA